MENERKLEEIRSVKSVHQPTAAVDRTLATSDTTGSANIECRGRDNTATSVSGRVHIFPELSEWAMSPRDHQQPQTPVHRRRNDDDVKCWLDLVGARLETAGTAAADAIVSSGGLEKCSSRAARASASPVRKRSRVHSERSPEGRPSTTSCLAPEVRRRGSPLMLSTTHRRPRRCFR